MKLNVILGAALAAAFVASWSTLSAGEGFCDPASRIFHGGPILTMSHGQPEVVAVRGERILFVGSRADARKACWYKKSAEYNLKGRTLMPGFISSHSHLVLYGALGPASEWVDVSAVNTHFRDPWTPTLVTLNLDDPLDRTTIIGKLEQKLREMETNGVPRDTWLNGFAYDPTRQTGPGLDKQILDEHLLPAERPVFVLNNSGHLAYVNSAALTKLNICPPGQTPPPLCKSLPENLATRALDTGVLQEEAIFLANPFVLPTLEQIPAIVKDSAMRFARHGYTTVNDAGPNEKNQLELLDAIFNPTNPINVAPKTRVYDPNFPLNIVAFPAGIECFGVKSNPCRDFLLDERKAKRHLSLPLKFGALKLWADGSPQGYTNAMKRPYFKSLDDMGRFPCCRDNLRQPDEVTTVIEQATDMGFQVAIHANGNLAINKVIRDLKVALKGDDERRPQFIHLAFASKRQLKRLKAIGAVATVLINDLYYWGGVECTTVFGPGLMRRQNYPTQFALNKRLSTSLHSDAPVTQPDPLFSIWVAAKREPQTWPPRSQPLPRPCAAPLNRSNRISIKEGLRAFTVEAAYQYFLEDEIGTLEAGKLADMVILSANPLAVSKRRLDDLLKIKVKATVSRGRLLNKAFWRAYLAD